MEKEKSLLQVKVLVDGPLSVRGSMEITLVDGTKEVKEKVSFCRCGSSENKPYCDGSHVKIGFKG